MSSEKVNVMREVLIDKVTLNIGVGEAGEKVNKAAKILELISGQKPVKTVSNKRIPTWGIRPGLAIGTKVTVRGSRAVELLKKLFEAVENKLHEYSFDDNGNFSFGIRSYIDVPGMKYDPEIGVYGLDVAVTLKRRGYRVKVRKRKRSKVGSRQRVKKSDAIRFVKEKFGVEVL